MTLQDGVLNKTKTGKSVYYSPEWDEIILRPTQCKSDFYNIYAKLPKSKTWFKVGTLVRIGEL